MKRLVFDLRDNPGGALDQAIAISNRFLPRGDMIVFTKGRIRERRSEVSRRGGERLHAPARSSCSSTATAPARPRSSAVRCRITIAHWWSAKQRSARRSCSRSIGSAATPGLALTTGRYYTPSGRLIQRPWDGSFDEYLTYTLRDQKAERQHSSVGPEIHGRRAQGLQRRRHRAGQVHRRSGRRASHPRASDDSCTRAARSPTSPISSSPKVTRASATRAQSKKRISRGFTVTDEMMQDFRALAEDPEDQDRRRGVQDRRHVHPRDDPLRHRPGAVRRRRSASESDRSRSAGTVRPRAIRRSAAADRTGAGHDTRRQGKLDGGQIALHFGL